MAGRKDSVFGGNGSIGLDPKNELVDQRMGDLRG